MKVVEGWPPNERRGLIHRLSGVDGLLLGTDFDGTLTPIQSDPETPVIAPACHRILSTIASLPNTLVAVISGRALTDLQPRVGVHGVMYAGNHGLELKYYGSTWTHPLARRHRGTIKQAVDRITTRIATLPGWYLEDKGVTATIHVRHTPAEHVDAIANAVYDTVQYQHGLRVDQGKEIFEIKPQIRWDKGTIMTRLHRTTPAEWATVYIGDDSTDEDGFRALKPGVGIGVHVGRTQETIADINLRNQAAVGSFLQWLTEFCLSPSD